VIHVAENLKITICVYLTHFEVNKSQENRKACWGTKSIQNFIIA